MINQVAGEGRSRTTDSENNEKHGDRRITVDVASPNQANSWNHETCNVHQLNISHEPIFRYIKRGKVSVRSYRRTSVRTSVKVGVASLVANDVTITS